MTEPMIFVRYLPGVVGETRRTTHLVPLPGEGVTQLRALCGERLGVGETERLTEMSGTPCALCLLRSPGPGERPEIEPAEPVGPRPRLAPGLFRTSA